MRGVKTKGQGNKKTGEFWHYGAHSNVNRGKSHGKGGYRSWEKVSKNDD